MASEMAGDRKVLCVFKELKQLAVDNNFEPTNPLTELLAEFACEGGLLDQERLILAHLLTRFTHQRLCELRRLLEIQQGRWNIPFIDGVLQVVLCIERDFGNYTSVASHRTSTESQPIAAPFNRFQGGSTVHQHLLRSDRSPTNQYESPWARQVAEPAPGPRPALRAFDIPPQPRTTNPSGTMWGLTSSGPESREFIGFGSTERRADGGGSRSAERGARAPEHRRTGSAGTRARRRPDARRREEARGR